MSHEILCARLARRVSFAVLLGSSMWRRRVSAAVVVLCLDAPSSWAAETPAVPRHGLLRGSDGRLPNVLLVTVDTLRADHVESHGSAFPGLTPNLDRLAAEGTVFLHTTSTAPATRPSLAGLMTGTHPGHHQVLSNHTPLKVGVGTLAQLLRKGGYLTAGIVGNDLLAPRSGLGRGFAHYESFASERGLASDAEGVRRALAWLAGSPREPWFLWLHLMTPHGPYNSAPKPPPMVAAREDPLPDRALRASRSNYGLGVVPRYQLVMGAERAGDYRRRYREEVFYVDARIGEVLRSLEDSDRSASTLVIVTSDHGESLGEQNLFFQHGWLPNEASVHVPMIWSLPGRVTEGHRVTAPVSLVDVLPTLVSGLGLHVPAGLAGEDLSAALRGGEPPEAAVFAVTAYQNRMTSVRRGDWKLVHTPRPPDPLPNDSWGAYYPTAESYALYDLGQDPREETDLSAAEPERAAALRAELTEWEGRNGLPGVGRESPGVDAATQKSLRALGYLD
jgi:arylsulfatase A-like enzyme